MNTLQELIDESEREFKQKIGMYAQSLVGKRVHFSPGIKNGEGSDEPTTTVKRIMYPSNKDMSPPLFFIEDEKGEVISIWPETEITEVQ